MRFNVQIFVSTDKEYQDGFAWCLEYIQDNRYSNIHDGNWIVWVGLFENELFVMYLYTRNIKSEHFQDEKWNWQITTPIFVLKNISYSKYIKKSQINDWREV